MPNQDDLFQSYQDDKHVYLAGFISGQKVEAVLFFGEE